MHTNFKMSKNNQLQGNHPGLFPKKPFNYHMSKRVNIVCLPSGLRSGFLIVSAVINTKVAIGMCGGKASARGPLNKALLD